MQNSNYKSALEQAVYALHNAENEIFTAMVNVGFTAVYDDISKLHEPGEQLTLELAMFESTGDANLDTLIQAVKTIAQAKQTIINLNAMDIKEEDLP